MPGDDFPIQQAVYVDLLVRAAMAWGLWIDPDTASRIVAHFLIVREENRAISLTGLRHEDERVAFIRLVVDSLSAALVIGPEGAAVDIGSGAGYPGLVLALLRPSQPWTLIEATRKKARFLERAIDSLDARNVSVVPDRAETWARTSGVCFRWATARAVGAPALLAELALPLLEVRGQALLMRGPRGRDEVLAVKPFIHELGGRIGTVRQLTLPEGQGARTLVQLEKTGSTPSRFPRIGGALGHL